LGSLVRLFNIIEESLVVISEECSRIHSLALDVVLG
jgi:hypothetical protein